MNKIKKLSLPVAILIASIIIGGLYFTSQFIFKTKQTSMSNQQNCSAMSEKYFLNIQDPSNPTYYTYTNHFNSKLNKCFILVSYSVTADDTLMLDLYDVLENKHYGAFMGHNFCDKPSLQFSNDPKKCIADSGAVWLNGDDTSSPDFSFGFKGLLNGGGAGNENTKNEFMLKIKPFMND